MDSFLSLKKRHITLKVVLYYVPLLLNHHSEKENSSQNGGKWIEETGKSKRGYFLKMTI